MTGFSPTRVFAVMIKEFKQLTRDRLTYAMMLAIPVVQLLLFGYAINSEPRHLPTALLVQEDSVFARSIVAALKNSAYFDLIAQARSPAELDELVRRGEVQFAITIPGDFTRRVARGDDAQVLVEADATDPSATGAAVVSRVRGDPSGPVAATSRKGSCAPPVSAAAMSAPSSTVPVASTMSRPRSTLSNRLA